MEEEEYSYPDEDDDLVDTWVKERQPYSGYWYQDSHEFIFSFFLDQIDSTHNRLLDIGCGPGDLFPFYIDEFEEVVAIEPDEERIEEAKSMAEKRGYENIQFKNKSLEEVELEDSSFDAVICSHVIQHIPTDRNETFISEVGRVLRKGGILGLMAAYKPFFDSKYVKTEPTEDGWNDETIDEDEFNRLTKNDDNILPTHNFSRQEIESLLDSFEIHEIKFYHDLLLPSIVDKFTDRNHLINKRFIKGKLGKDIFVLAEK